MVRHKGVYGEEEMSYYLKHHWGLVFLLPFIFSAFALWSGFVFQGNDDNYNISYSHITGTVVATECDNYGTKVMLDNGFVTLNGDIRVLIGRIYDFTYENYTLKMDNWWNRFIGTRDSMLTGFSLQ